MSFARQNGSGDQVILWWLETSNVAEDGWALLEALLDESERARARRFHFERDRQTYIAAHALGRTLLSSQIEGAPQSWRFTIGPHGKPELVVPPEGPRWRLNLSHTRGLAAAALILDHEVGVDVEWLGRQTDCIRLSRRFFSQAECDALDAVPEENRAETFLTFWTLKESYIKAIGKGLAQPLDAFAFTLDPLAVHFLTPDQDDPAQWLFYRHRPTPGHLLALALRHPQPSRVTVTAQAMEVEDLCRTPGKV